MVAYNSNFTNDTGYHNGVFAHFFAADGSSIAEFQVGDVGQQYTYKVTMAGLAGGGAVIATASSDIGISAQIFNDRGEPETSDFLVVAQSTYNLAITALADGGFVMIYGDMGVAATIYNADGSVRVPEFSLPLHGHIDSMYAAGLQDGNWAITYTAYGDDVNAGPDFYAQVFSPNTGGPPTLSCACDGGKEVVGDVADNALAGSDCTDVIKGLAGNDTLDGGGSGDSLVGGAGRDFAGYASAAMGLVADLANAAGNTGDAAGDSYRSIENLLGSAYADVLRGNGGSNRIDGGGGKDTLNGRGGNDTLEGNAGDDHVIGGSGADRLAGNGGSDTLQGGAGADQLDGGFGKDRLVGNAGSDTLDGGGSGDGLAGGAGSDAASYASSATGLVADLANASANTGDAAGDSYSSIENLLGSANADVLRGDSGANLVGGGNGADTLIGRAGNDTLEGAAGSDHLNAGGGNDVLAGGRGNDTLAGGGDDDLVKGGSGNDVERGATGDDRMFGNGGADTVIGGGGNDTANGGGGADQMTGGGGADVLNGSAGNDHLNGGTGGDVLNGGTGRDDLKGGGGHDTIDGGKGDDSVAGGAMTDTFAFAGNFGHDTVSGFSANNHEDIDLSGVSAITGLHNLITHHLTTDNDTGFALITVGTSNTILIENYMVDDFGAGQPISGADFIFS